MIINTFFLKEVIIISNFEKSIIERFDSIFHDEDKKEFNNNRRYYRHNRSLNKIHMDTLHLHYDILEFFDLLDQIENNSLFKALKQLNQTDLQIIKLKYIHKFTLHEIANILDLNHETVKKKHSRAIRRMKEIVK